MEFTIKQRTFQSICSDIGSGAINFDSYLQRQVGQWSPIQKSKLIDSILRGYPIPPIYGVKADKALSIIDGCQRASTVYSFKKDGFSLSSTLTSIEYEEKDSKGKASKVTFDLAKKSYKQLPAVLQKQIDDFEITVTTLTNPTNQEIIDCFDRLNGGTPLSKAQKNKVFMNYELAQDIANIAKGNVFNLTSLSKTQVKRDEPQMVIAQSLMLLDPNYTVNGFSATQVQKYLADFSKRYDKTLLSKLADILDHYPHRGRTSFCTEEL